MVGMRPEDIYALSAPSDPRVSPDGTQVAFVVTTLDETANDYRSRIWLAPIGGGRPPTAVTAGPRRDRHPRWSPDGTRLAFTSNRAGEEGSELYVMPRSSGEPVQVAAFPETIEELAWSPDGTRIAFLVRVREEERYSKARLQDQPPRQIRRLIFRLDSVGWTVDRPRHLMVVDADGGAEPRALTGGECQVSAFAWSPEGDEIAFISGRHDTWDRDLAADICVIAAAGGEPQRLTQTGPQYDAVSWQPGGSLIAFAVTPRPMNEPSHGRIGVIDRGDRSVRMLTGDLDRNASTYPQVREPIWDGSTLYFLIEDGGNVHLLSVDAGGSSAPCVVVGGERCVTGVDAVAGTIAVTATTATEPAELFVLTGGDTTRLTDLGRALTSGRAIVAPERFVAVSPDGTEVEAWVMRPAGHTGGERHPALLNIHGGPFTQYGNRLFDEFQVFAGAGYAVIYANPRGSSGYSEAWGRAIRGPKAVDPGSGWGGVDYEDLMAVVDEAVRRFDFIDGERLGVLGGSYGGYMTSWIAGHTSRFVAGCSERAVNNLLTSSWTSDFGPFFAAAFGATHLEDPQEYLRMSPITYVEKMTMPLLILHSEEDLRCPIEQAEQLFVALKLLGREVEFHRFPGESHELSRSGSPMHRVERFRIILDWFDRHLK